MSNKEYLRQELNQKNQAFSEAIKKVYESIQQGYQSSKAIDNNDSTNYLALCRKKDEVALILEYLIIHNCVFIQCLLSICCANIIPSDRSKKNIDFGALKSKIIEDKNTARALLFFFGFLIFGLACALTGILVIHLFMHSNLLLADLLKIALFFLAMFLGYYIRAPLDEYNEIKIIKSNLQGNGNVPNYTFKLVKDLSTIIEDINEIEVKILDGNNIQYNYILFSCDKINSDKMYLSEKEMSFLNTNNCISSNLRKLIMAELKKKFNNIYYKDVAIEYNSVTKKNAISKTTTTLRLFNELQHLKDNTEVNKILNPQ